MDGIEQALKEEARNLGFQLVGIASAEPFSLAEARMLEWLARGYQAEMAWMNEARARLACQPQELLPSARSIISVGVSYLTQPIEGFAPQGGSSVHGGKRAPSERAAAARPSRHAQLGTRAEPVEGHSPLSGTIARYARGGDYHDAIRQRLWRLVGFLEQRLGSRPQARVFVDSSPFPDREAAVRAGLGFYGKNTMLLTGPLGSFLFLGAVLTDVELEPDQPQVKDCGQCRLCIDACPTAALEPYQLDANRCIAYLTIEHRGSIPPELRMPLGTHVFGCDICQEVCPWNRRVPLTRWPEFSPRPRDASHPELIPLLSLDEQGFRQRFRGSAILRAKRAGFVRNAAVALGNSGDRRAIPALARALRDPEPLVRAHAAWALGRLGGEGAQRALEQRLRFEADPQVRSELESALSQAKRHRRRAKKSATRSS